MIETKNRPYSNRELILVISHNYSPLAERQMILELREKGMSREQEKMYLTENLLKFFLEYAAGVKKTHINYEINPNNQLVYKGTNLVMEGMMTKAVLDSNMGKSEQAELEGWQKTEQLLTARGYNHAFQLSPPDRYNIHHGNYGFLYWFEKTSSQKVTNHILRYDENQQELSKTLSLANELGLGNSLNRQNITNDLLSTPTGISGSSGMIKEKLLELGFSFDNSGERLEQELLRDPIFMLNFGIYFRNITGHNFNHEQAETALLEMYKIAEIKASMWGLLDKRVSVPLVPLIFYGGSCPVINRGPWSYGYASYLYDSSSKATKVTHCPSCGKSWLVSSEHGIYGIRCSCGNKVAGGNGAKCIVGGAALPTAYDLQSLNRAKFAKDSDDSDNLETWD